MTSKPLCTVITVCRNSERYIRDAILSVLNQTYPNIEYIVIDGDSTDGTLAILQEYESKFRGRMHWISETDEGIYDAMNKGIAMASGDIIGILNSDDWYDKLALAKVVANYQEHVDIYYGSMYKVRRLYGQNYRRLVKPGPLADFPRKMVVAHPASFVTKAWYKKFGVFDTQYKIAADYKFLFHSYMEGARFKRIDYPLTYMREGGTSSAWLNYEGPLIQKELAGKWHIRAYIIRQIKNMLYRIRYPMIKVLVPRAVFRCLLKRRGWELMN